MHAAADRGSGLASARSPILALIIVCFVLVGACSTITSKIMYQSDAVTSTGMTVKFERPLLQNAGMFMGMSMALGVLALQQRFGSKSLLLKAVEGTTGTAAVATVEDVDLP